MSKIKDILKESEWKTQQSKTSKIISQVTVHNINKSVMKEVLPVSSIISKEITPTVSQIDYKIVGNACSSSMINNSKGIIQCMQSIYENPSILSSLPDSILTAIKKDNINLEQLSILQSLCLSKFVDDKNIDYGTFKNKRKQLSKKEAEQLISVKKVDYNEKTNRFYYDSQIISFKTLKECAKAAQLFDDITAEELIDFIKKYSKKPLLALNHPTAQKIYDKTKELKKEHLTIIPLHTQFFRARVLPKNEMTFLEDEMRKPPYGIPNQGRFNSTGVNMFYVTATIEGACNEMKKHSSRNQRLQVAEYKSDYELKVLDIRGWNNDFGKYLQYPITDNNKIHKQYFIPNFLSDCIREQRIDGIIYQSGENTLYAFFTDRHFEYIDDKVMNI